LKRCSKFIYDAKVIKIVDGDTIDAEIDLGFNVKIKERIRFAGINTPELKSKDPNERSRALKAKQFVEEWFKKYNYHCVLKTIKSEPKKGKYGRYIAYVMDPLQRECLNTILLEKGLADIYIG
jgi:micrococcal nuclease